MFFFTYSSDGLDLHGVFAWLSAFLLQLCGELFQVFHSPLVGRDQSLKIAGRKETNGPCHRRVGGKGNAFLKIRSECDIERL